MIVKWEKSGDRLMFTFTLEKDDSSGPLRNPAGAQRLHYFTNKSFYIKVPREVNYRAPHPDLIALALIVLVNDFVGSRIVVKEGVSKVLADGYNNLTGKTLTPIDKKLEPRITTEESRPSLSYSGGVDSTAAVSIMPDDTVMVFADRTQHTRQKYNKTAAHQSCDELKKLGKEVYRVETDLEYLIDPYTFSHPLAAGIPAILLADSLDLDTIGFGNLLENIYGLLDNKYQDANNSTFTKYDLLFEKAGLPAAHVTAGLTVYSTSLILNNSKTNAIAQSCMYGTKLGHPCMSCLKCLYKVLFQDIIQGKSIDDSTIDKLFSSESVSHEFISHPTRIQNAYMYLATHLQEEHKLVRLLKRKLGAKKYKTNWMAHWYSPATLLLPDKYKKEIEDRILSFLKPMTAQEERKVRRWNIKRQRYSIVRWYWHWRFWQYYGKIFGKHILSFNKDSIRLEKGESCNELRVYSHLPLWLKKDVTEHVHWGSSDGSVAYYKDGEVRAKNTGSVTLIARYEKSRAQIGTDVI